MWSIFFLGGRILFSSYFFLECLFITFLFTVEGSADELIKQELQAVAEGVAASVLQSSMPSNPDITTMHDRSETLSEVNQDSEVQNTDVELNKAGFEVLKTALPSLALVSVFLCSFYSSICRMHFLVAFTCQCCSNSGHQSQTSRKDKCRVSCIGWSWSLTG